MVKYYSVLYEKGFRSNNQDSLSIQKMQTNKGEALLAIICDGVGGLSNGEIASGYLVESMSSWFYDMLPDLLQRRLSVRQFRNIIFKKIYTLHTNIKNYGIHNGISLASTLSMLLILDQRYFIIHIGDSCIYRIRSSLQDNEIKKMTISHVVNNHRISKCIGNGPFETPDFNYGHLRKNMDFLLASDGMTGHLTDQDLLGILPPKKIKKEGIEQWKCYSDKYIRQLYRKALAKGEKDNISAILIKTN